MEAITPLDLDDLNWDGTTPKAPAFDDVYFSASAGAEESLFVFLEGTALADVWQQKSHVTVGETGFGTGLNFLKTWQRWRRKAPDCRLTFISVEKYPLTRRALHAAHEHFPDLAPLAQQLRDKWPPPTPGFHLRAFEDGRVKLLLLQGDAARLLSALHARVDVWYLDGFAPAKNKGMWSDAVFDQIARLSVEGARLATFTAAGFVRRGLSERGFDMQKTPGYGRKRERLVGRFARPQAHKYMGKRWATPAARCHRRIAVIGAGVAGTFLARSLGLRGMDTRLFKSPLASTASTVPAAVIAPQFTREKNALDRFIPSAYFNALADRAIADHMMTPGGLMVRPTRALPQSRLDQMFALATWDPCHISRMPNGSLSIPASGCVDTTGFFKKMHSSLDITEAHVTSVTRQEGEWQLLDEAGMILGIADTVVFATGYQDSFHPQLTPLAIKASRGQTSLIAADKLPDLEAGSLAFGGYLSPELVTQKDQPLRLLGSSFDRWHGDDWQVTRAADHEELTSKLAEATGASLSDVPADSHWIGRRTSTRDHFPLVGPLPDWSAFCDAYALLGKDAKRDWRLPEPPLMDGLYVFTGLGARGFQYAPLLADALAAEITGEPYPLECAARDGLHPGRFHIRDIIRGRAT